MNIAFFIGSVDISGGSYVIYQHALYAKRAGHNVTIVALLPYTAAQLAWHPATQELRILPVELAGEERYDLVIATWWKTASEVHRLNAYQYAYFVQSIEYRFYPENQAPLRRLVNSTYTLPLPGITEAVWIQEYLSRNYNHQYWLVRNGIRKDIYNEMHPPKAARLHDGQLRVLVEGPFGVFFKNVGRTLKLAHQAKSDEVWLLTSSEVPWYPFVDRLFSRVKIDEVAAVYRSCDLILKLSYVEGMFGPPLEMFHCGGTAVVYDVTGHDEYIENGRNGLVIKRDNEAGVVDALQQLKSNPDLLAKLKQGARETADNWPDWNHASASFFDALTGIMDLPRISREMLRVLNMEAQKVYIEEEQARLTSNPHFNIYSRLDPIFRRLPKRLALGLRLGRYIWEGLR